MAARLTTSGGSMMMEVRVSCVRLRVEDDEVAVCDRPI